MVSLNNAEDVFGEVLLELMDELNFDRFSAAEQRAVIHEMFEEHFRPTWQELLDWYRFGDDRRAITLERLRRNVRLTSMVAR